LHESKDHDHNVLWIRSSQAKNWCHVHVWWCCRLSTVKTYLIIFYTSCWINCIVSYKFYQYFFDYNAYESGFESLFSNLQSLISVWNRVLVLMRSGNVLPICSVDEFLPIKAHLNKRGRLIHHYNKYDA
jgi:hypothetical protein